MDSAGKSCYTDADCGAASGLYCDGGKAKLLRDVRRLSDLRAITEAAEKYKISHDNTPVQLLAGSYIRGISLSVWPSWSETLGKILGITMPLDPLNSLWGCRNDSDKDPAGDGTCWNETNKNFNGGDSLIPAVLSGLGRVYSYIYPGAAGEESYQVCANNEYGYVNIFGEQQSCF